MLNFKSSTALLISALILIAFTGMLYSISIWLFLIPVIPYILLIIYGSASVQSQFFMSVYCRNKEIGDAVSITFDDGPSPETTPLILDILKANQVTATFFCIGEKVIANPELMQRIADEGHIIGNHSYSHHFFFDLFSHDAMVREIRNTNKAIDKIVRKKTHLFRPPYGVTTPVLAKAVKKSKVTVVGWSLRSFDTVIKDPDKLITKISTRLKPGDVILLHDTQEVTAKALQSIIENIDNSGLAIVPVDELLNIHAYV